MKYLTLLFFAVAIIPSYAKAQSISFGMPVGCTLGKDCYIQNYVDHTPGKGSQDFTCGGLTYDGHKGTDFALPSDDAMRKGVDVYAAEEGVVKGVRDSMQDINFREISKKRIEGRECGNGMVIDHGKGWETQYCHLKKDSIVVKQGDKVAKGQKLGEIGLSGKTEFPHLHFSVRYNGEHFDPFTAGHMDNACSLSPQEQNLWDDDIEQSIKYVPTGLVSSGFAGRVVKMDEILSGEFNAKEMPYDSEAIIFWSVFYGVKSGDEIRFRLTSPSGVVISNSSKTIKKSQVRRYDYVGKKNSSGMLELGEYKGQVRLMRRGSAIAGSDGTITVSK